MPLILPGNVGSATAATGYDVANSCRFNRASSDSLNKTLGTPTNVDIATFSTWIKFSDVTSSNDTAIFAATADGNNTTHLEKLGSQVFRLNMREGSTYIGVLTTNRKFRDPSAWFHIVVAFDTTQGTEANRIKLYINGVQETSFSTATYPTQNVDLRFNTSGQDFLIGNRGDTGNHPDAYFAETVFIDGQQLAADQFGEFDEDSGIWKPIDVSELTFGTNGFYLDFEDSANLGNDANGGTDLTEVNLAATDQSTDTCTNNFATLNPLHSIGAASELSQGNLEYDPSGHHRIISTIAPSSGMWYAEVKGIDSPDKFMAGICYYPIPANGSASSFAFGQGVNADVGRFANDFGLRADGEYGNNNSYSSYMSTPGNNDIIGIYMDLDNYKLYFSLNGSLVSATGKDLTNNGEPYGFISVGEGGTFQWNFGNPSFALANTAITDDNGFGAFEYSPNITGDSEAKSFFALCTKNLAEYG